MHREFAVHMLTERGKELAVDIAKSLDRCLSELEVLCGHDGRYMSLVRTKMEEAGFFAKKAMAEKNSDFLV